jgi:ABC-type transport system involved in multi-copper enzyme maturation permease subunit
VIALIGFGTLFCAVTANRWPHMRAAEQAAFDPALTSLRGYFLAQLAIGVLGVLVITGEYATGMIRATMSAVPRRLPVLWAKAVLYAAVTWVLATVGALIAFLIGQAVLSSRHIETSIASPGVARVVFGTGLYLTVVGLLGVAIGCLIRNTAGGIATVFGLLLVVPVLAEALPSSWSNAISPYLPSNAGQAVIALHPDPHTLAPWSGIGLFLLYALAALAAAAVLLKRRDA